MDGEDARDFDHGSHCEKKRGGGWRLWVAIADVSYYVRPPTPLDREARIVVRRCTSLRRLSRCCRKCSNGLCSLNPQVPPVYGVRDQRFRRKAAL
ncbi:RNB domain-containing ribonuclease [Shigella flexneri]